MHQTLPPTILATILLLTLSCGPTGECIQGECQNGPGVMEFPDGSLFRGQFRGGEMLNGLMADPEGDIYDGDFVDGQREGYGTYSYRATGGKYTGQFAGNEAHGFGQYGFGPGISGETYVGEWRNNERHGLGDYHHGDDGRRYIGEMRNDRFEGFGFFERSLQGSIDPYEFRYMGEFFANKMHGKGIMHWRDGRRFVGDWNQGEMRRGVLSYEKPHSRAGDVYVGGLLDELPEGEGTYVFRDGRRYTGGFRSGEFHGEGRLVYPSPLIALLEYRGEFRLGEFHGQGTLVYKDGRVESGRFESGQFVGAGSDKRKSESGEHE